MRVIDGGVTAAKGFYATGIAANLRKPGKQDMALVYSEVPAVTAGTFTTNIVKAAPVKWDIKLIAERETARAMVANSGIANACTGEEGMKFNEAFAESTAEALGIDKYEVITASTGVIGEQLPIEKVKAGTKEFKKTLENTREAGSRAAKAIMTTDTVSKEIAVVFNIGGKDVTIGGMCKGSGMIHPNMATMLAFITTDCAISKEMLVKAVKADVKDSFNMVSVDRDTSTNDSLMVMANGLAGNEPITCEGSAYDEFRKSLACVTQSLAKMIASDGEGATKLFEVKLVGASTKEQAVTLSKSIITSNLVKTMIYGADANWGRIVCAMGYSGAKFDPDVVDVTIKSAAGELQIVENGVTKAFDESFATAILSEKEVTAVIDIKEGNEKATAWGCDLTYEYVKINGDYRS